MSGDSRSPRVGCGAAILRAVKRKRSLESNQRVSTHPGWFCDIVDASDGRMARSRK
jgi:hypothetical protein